ncbi:MAG TPA: N-acetylglucosamine-6-phosphate deacetylase [Terriglobales bacterium]|nr:N-acetylglucosamine-6-phosphate deacetylase [Terriglobales bacterium]
MSPSPPQALIAASLIAPQGVIAPAVLVMQDGRITAVGTPATTALAPGTRVGDLGEAVLAPGFIDLHVHGGAGIDLMAADSTGVAAFTRHLAAHGVTSFLATTVTAPWEATLRAVERLAAVSLGLHLEGPFLSAERRGVHPESDLLPPTPARLTQLWEAAQGRIRLITIAPELEGALDFIAAASARGIRISLGHSAASRAQAQAGIRAGARHVTHTFNAMNPLHHRDPGLLGEALMNPALSAEIIADGIHVDPLLVQMFFRLKGPERAILVSDALSAAGCGDGRYQLGAMAVEVKAGHCIHEGRLAGSVLTLDQAVRNAMTLGGSSLPAAVAMATRNPAALLGLTHKGRLEVGADADIVVLSPAGEVQATYIAGMQVH